MATLARLRSYALSLPEVTEQDHHGFPSFRVSGRIFATVPDALHVHIMLDEPEVRMAVAAAPESVAELWWGKQLAGVRVAVLGAPQALLTDLLAEAYRRKAPSRLLATSASSQGTRAGEPAASERSGKKPPRPPSKRRS